MAGAQGGHELQSLHLLRAQLLGLLTHSGAWELWQMQRDLVQISSWLQRTHAVSSQ